MRGRGRPQPEAIKRRCLKGDTGLAKATRATFRSPVVRALLPELLRRACERKGAHASPKSHGPKREAESARAKTTA